MSKDRYMSRKMTSLSAGYAICGVLQEALRDKVNGVFPVICMNSDVKYPFVTYRRLESEREATKSAYNADMDSCSVSVSVFDDDYERGLSIIEDARAAIEGKTVEYQDEADPDDTLTVKCARVTSSDEVGTTRAHLFRKLSLPAR